MELYFTLYSLYVWVHYMNLDSEICSWTRWRPEEKQNENEREREREKRNADGVSDKNLRNCRINGNRGYFCCSLRYSQFLHVSYTLYVCVCTVGFEHVYRRSIDPFRTRKGIYRVLVL